jgi:quercetin dioxygenase-like cupin family protein
MTNSNNSIKSKKLTNSAAIKVESALNSEITAAIASKIIPTTPAPEVALRIKSKLMKRALNNNHEFVFTNQGRWKVISEGVKIKLLHEENNTKSFMLIMDANTSIPAHLHTHDEESFVVKGDVYIEGILCHEGDYHYAHAGSKHQMIKTTQGCTLLIRNL